MRMILTNILVMMMAVSCQQGDGASTGKVNASIRTTTVQWLDSAKNLGKLKEGEKLEVNFRFINTGEHPLVINGVTASCGCTVPEKPTEPVAPGEEGMVRAVFDSKGRVGMNHKTVTVYANTEQPMYPLVFEVEVTPAQ